MLTWKPRRKVWASVKLVETSEVILEKLLCTFLCYLESKFTEDVEGDDLTAQQEAEMNARCRRPQEACMSYRY